MKRGFRLSDDSSGTLLLFDTYIKLLVIISFGERLGRLNGLSTVPCLFSRIIRGIRGLSCKSLIRLVSPLNVYYTNLVVWSLVVGDPGDFTIKSIWSKWFVLRFFSVHEIP